MAISDADYKFVAVDIGQVGSASDAGVWDQSTFGEAWNSGKENNCTVLLANSHCC